MSIGIDFGNESCAVAVVRNRGIDMIPTAEFKYETPTTVCFGKKQRLFGASGSFSAMTNPNNTISQIKRLVGCKFSDPNLQRDLQHFPFSVTDGPDGFPLIHVMYNNEQHTFTPTQALAMVLAHLKKLAEKNISGTISDCCIGIPVFFTDIQRRAVLDAAKIAGLNNPRLVHEMTAVALGYGIYKTDLPKTSDKLNVAFVDVGHASMQVCIVEYKSGHLKILGHAFDQSLGGRDFDNALFKHFAAKFKKEHNVDVSRNLRACARLMSACEKTKKMLSANPVAHINIECLMNEKDMNYEIKREEFEYISSSLLQRVAPTLAKALEVADIREQEIDEVEVVGSGSRVPAIAQILKDFFKEEPTRTMNSSECVACGCALHCASLSPAIRVRELKSEESFPFPVAILWRDDMSEMQETRMQKEWRTPIFPSGCPTPSPVLLKFDKSSTFSFDVIYGDRICVQSHKFSTYTIGPFYAEKGETNVSMLLDYNGIVSVTSATLNVEEDEDVFVNGELVNGVRITKIVNNAANTEARAGTTSYVQDNLKDLEREGKVKIDVPISEHIYGGLSSLDVQNALEKEYDMACKDKVVLETKETKNALEAYVYNIREQLNGKYQDFVEERERESVDHKLQEMEDWLYNEGEDEGRATYTAKLEELKNLATPIEVRYGEDLHRQDAINHLVQWLNYCKGICSGDLQWDHIDPAKMNEVSVKCSYVEQWLNVKIEQQMQVPKHANPVLLCENLKNRADELRSFCNQIMPKPKPQPNSQPSSAPRKECAVNYQDKRTEETKEARKALKAFVVTMRKELNGKYQDFVGELEKGSLAHKLQQLEDWLYGEGDKEDKDAYVAELEELTKLRKPVEVRYKEDVERESAISVLVNIVNDYVGIICSGDPQWDHINPTEKQTMLNECNSAQRWLGMKRQEQDRLTKNVDPVLLCADLVDAANHLNRVCRTIISKPRPQDIYQPSPISREAATFSRSPQQTLYRAIYTIDEQKGGRTYNPRTQADRKKVKEARKALEAFNLTTTKELNGKYRDFVAPLEGKLVIKKLKEIEQWLHNEGKDQDKAVYLSKLGEVTRLSNIIEVRYNDDQHRESLISCLAQWIQYYKEITCSADQRWDHIDPTEKQKVVDVCNLVEQWLNDRKLKQEHLPKYADPVLKCDYLQNARKFIISYCKPIMFKPKPEQIPQPSFANP